MGAIDKEGKDTAFEGDGSFSEESIRNNIVQNSSFVPSNSSAESHIDEDEPMHDYDYEYEVLHSGSGEHHDIDEDDPYGIYGNDGESEFNFEDTTENVDYDDEELSLNEDEDAVSRERDRRPQSSSSGSSSESEDESEENEDEEDEENAHHEDEEESEDEIEREVRPSAATNDPIFGIVSGDRRGASFLRDLLERGRSGQSGDMRNSASTPANILAAMQRLVDGLDMPGPSREHSEIAALIENIMQREDSFVVMESVSELSERLLMMDGITAERAVMPHQLAPALVGILTDPVLADDLELHLVTCRCLYNFVEVNADFINDALNASVVETLVAKLLDIVYIDLTEQCLQTLEIVSRDRGAQGIILASDGLRACLQHLDFLTVHSQRKCLQIVANACENISTAHFDFVLDQFHSLVAVAEHHDDADVKKSAWLGVSRIIDSFKGKPDYLEKLFSNDELLCHILTVIRDSCNPSSTDISLNYHSMMSLLKSLIVLISTSVKISNRLLDLGIGEYLRGSLNKFRKNDDLKSVFPLDVVSIESLISCPKELLALFLNVIAHMLPITYSPKETPFLQDNYALSSTKRGINYERNSSYRNEMAATFLAFVAHVWPVLVGSFQATMDFPIRKQVLICFSRIVSFTNDTDTFRKKDIDSLLGIVTSIISSGKKFVATATASFSDQERSLNAPLLLLSSTCAIILNLLSKSQLSCAHVLEREGVFNDISKISAQLGKADLQKAVDDTTNEMPLRSHFSNPYQEKFADAELYDYSQHMNVRSIFLHMQCTVTAITRLRNDYMQSGEDSAFDNDIVKSIVENLAITSHASSVSFDQWSKAWSNFTSVLGSGDRSMSSFELGSSGLLDVLKTIFSSSSMTRQSREVAKYAFIQCLYEDNTKLSRLIALLQDSLARAESFEVISSGTANNFGPEGGSASLAKQIKIKLIPDDEQGKNLLSDSDHVMISVQAIATFKGIVRFLKHRQFITGATRNFETSDQPLDNSHEADIVHEPSFYIGDKRIEIDSTVFGVVFNFLRADSATKKVDGFDLWSKPHEIHFRVDTFIAESPEIIPETLVEPLDTHTESILSLLRAIFEINEDIERSKLFPALSDDAFMNWKLTVKLNKQLEEPLIVASGAMPTWSTTTTNNFSFLFPLKTRMFFLQSTSFGYSRFIHTWLNRAMKDSTESSGENSSRSQGSSLSLGAPARKKLRISRAKIFKGAIKILQQYASRPCILEIEYLDEVGTGLGPTLEFYSSVSKAFCRQELLMWKNDFTSGEFVSVAEGLFPAPMGDNNLSESQKKVLFFFRMLGIFVARALLDSRIIDFNFNILFISLIQDPTCLDRYMEQNSDVASHIALLKQLDLHLGNGMQNLARYLDVYSESAQDEHVRIDGVELADLSLDFTVPGYADELVRDGKNIAVTTKNLESYIKEVTKFFVMKGVTRQIHAFREGFSAVFPIKSLSIFTAKELKEIFGSGEEDWTRGTITESMKANHGYSQDSKAIHMLVNVLQDFTISERRDFLQFLTGSPRLPIGGFKAMRPEFTVVRRYPDPGLSGDDYLPSVMTCANYLKLPDYTSEELLRTKLLHAIHEGAGAFHLS